MASLGQCPGDSIGSFQLPECLEKRPLIWWEGAARGEGTDVTDCLPMLQKRSPRTGSLVSDRIHSGG